ncbi:Sodium/calcium exchanger regulatory protein 1 [Anthophora quadrimaculata]
MISAIVISAGLHTNSNHVERHGVTKNTYFYFQRLQKHHLNDRGGKNCRDENARQSIPLTLFVLPDPSQSRAGKKTVNIGPFRIEFLCPDRNDYPLVLYSQVTCSRESRQIRSIAMPEFLGKRYKLFSSENFDEFMKALGVGAVTRKMGSSVSPVVELTENNGLYTLKTTSAFKNSEIKFKLGEEFDEETPDGRKVKSVCTLDGNKLIQLQKGEKETTIEREFTPTEMKAVMKVDDIVCTRVYKIQE